jgi:hypothetical protein
MCRATWLANHRRTTCLANHLCQPGLPPTPSSENSCRKEAGALLARYLQQCSSASGSAKPDEADEAAPASAPLAAVKIACRGLVALKLAAHAAPPASAGSGPDSGSTLVQQVAAALLSDIDSGKQKRLQHVQRVIPVQTTCELSREGLQAAGARLAEMAAAQVPQAGDVSAVRDGQAQQQRKVTFGIALKHRPLQPAAEVAAGDSGQQCEADAPTTTAAAAVATLGDAPSGPSNTAEGGSQGALDRGDIIRTLASGFEVALRQQHGVEAAVDLKTPELVLVVEVLPAGGALYAALCVLPRSLCVLKPRMHIRPVGKPS